jgi:hypothetical protein
MLVLNPDESSIRGVTSVMTVCSVDLFVSCRKALFRLRLAVQKEPLDCFCDNTN